uniref:EF-hand domain-containing protein n=1 Tax=Globodera rostochiensis TaxID=31243 RepID=A0A914GZB2_GLORO
MLIKILAFCLLILKFSRAIENSDHLMTENVSDFDVIDKDADSLISYAEFQRWHKLAMSAEPRESAVLFGTHDKDADGNLNVAEFVPLAFELSRKPDSQADKVFKKFDANADERLEREELLKGDSVSEEIVDGLFQVADVNADGRISFEEFSSVANALESRVSPNAKNSGIAQSLLAQLDMDKDEGINGTELFEYAHKFGGKESRTETDKVLRSMDLNGDGALSLEELKAVARGADACRRHQTVA